MPGTVLDVRDRQLTKQNFTLIDLAFYWERENIQKKNVIISDDD